MRRADAEQLSSVHVAACRSVGYSGSRRMTKASRDEAEA